MNEFPGLLVRGHEPRASRIRHAGAYDLPCEIWMGGSDALVGEPIADPDLGSSVVVDCAGELAAELRERCALYVPRVFMDAEVRPFAYARLAALVHELAPVAAGGPLPAALGGDGRTTPARIYVLCTYGMNRSGLVTGMLLRALGVETEAALAAIRRARPGALSNQTFCGLLSEWRCPEQRADGVEAAAAAGGENGAG